MPITRCLSKERYPSAFSDGGSPFSHALACTSAPEGVVKAQPKSVCSQWDSAAAWLLLVGRSPASHSKHLCSSWLLDPYLD